MSTLVFYDDVDVSLLPAADYYAGYADGIYANIAAIKARFPNAGILTIAVKATDVADCLDIETGDATIAQAPAWFKLSLAKGVTKPCLYTSVSNVNDLVATMTAAGIVRTAYRIWSAHYGLGSHICGPTTCKETTYACDATQFTDTADSKSLDESVALSTFFTDVTPPPLAANPTLTSGDTGIAVKALQTRLNLWHANPALAVDGDFGADTLAAVKAFQTSQKLTVDGIVGPATWTALNKTPTVVAFAAPGKLGLGKQWVASWEAPADLNGKPPTGYLVELIKDGKVIESHTVTVETATFLDLSGTYTVSVTAQGGTGSPAATFTFRA